MILVTVTDQAILDDPGTLFSVQVAHNVCDVLERINMRHAIDSGFESHLA